MPVWRTENRMATPCSLWRVQEAGEGTPGHANGPAPCAGLFRQEPASRRQR